MIKSMVTDKDISDIWDAIRSIRTDIELLKKTDEGANIDFLQRSYTSIIERLDMMEQDIDALKK